MSKYVLTHTPTREVVKIGTTDEVIKYLIECEYPWDSDNEDDLKSFYDSISIYMYQCDVDMNNIPQHVVDRFRKVNAVKQQYSNIVADSLAQTNKFEDDKWKIVQQEIEKSTVFAIV